MTTTEPTEPTGTTGTTVTTVTRAEAGLGDHFVRAFRWHRPLMTLALVMAGLAVVGIAGLLFDDRVLTGLPIWAKPTKFAVSILIYSVTWAWLIGQLTRVRRTAWWMGAVAAVFLGVEMVIIVGQVLRGTTSHFNQTTPFNAMLFTAMGASIALVWVATLVVCVILFVNPGPDRARNLAVRAGAIVAVIGMALGFLMVMPTEAQIASGESISGAHTVGLSDGGPSLPLLGWSTVGGDLRIPHFVGMHALQLIPLVVIGLELLAPRLPLLSRRTVKVRLVALAVGGYVALLALLTWQALRGQSIVHPDVLTGATFAVIVICVGAGVTATLRQGSRATKGAGTPGDHAPAEQDPSSSVV